MIHNGPGRGGGPRGRGMGREWKKEPWLSVEGDV